MGTIRKNIQNIVAMLLIAALLTPASVGAEQYDVNAFVPYPTPSQPATIDVPAPNTVFQNSLQSISGTCEAASPVNIVSVWRSGQLLGSAACTGGSYSIQVALTAGQNTLVARTAKQNGIYGPDSSAVLVTFETPVVVEPLPPSVNEPTTTTQRTGATNQGALQGLSLRTESPFSVLTSGNLVSIRVVVEGGKNPYVLLLNWGDGSTESRTIAQAGTYEFTHAYQKHRGYTVYIRVKDVLGSFTEYVYAVVSSEKAGNQEATSTGAASSEDHGLLIRWYVWLFVIALLFFVLTSYWIGWHRAKRRYDKKPLKSSGQTKQKKRRKEQK
ncbi:hypothetical protein KDA14_03560 [Candidatus Saccharibacteria bacterium]|nr:hypothetical protein [Candidatus Saccharibacteria bacterium]